MDELQIARSTAAILDGLSNYGERTISDSGYGSDDRRRFTGRFHDEELQLLTLKTMTYELAMARASGTSCDFESVLRETELEVTIQLARILAGTVDPVIEGLKTVVVEDGEVCGVCQEEMDGGDEARGMAMGCLHKFHGFCIWRWLREKNACPLCRHHMKFNTMKA